MGYRNTIGICFVLTLVLVLGMTGCGRSKRRAAKASRGVDKQKAAILEDYRKCLKKNPDNKDACESYRKALEGL